MLLLPMPLMLRLLLPLSLLLLLPFAIAVGVAVAVAVAMAIAVAAQWIANYVVSSTYPILKDSPALKSQFDGGFPYFVYGVMGILAALFMWKFVPETKGRTLEEMEGLWRVAEKKA